MKPLQQKLVLFSTLIAIITLPLFGGYIVWNALPPGFSILATTEMHRPGFNLAIFIILSLMFIGIFSFLLFPHYFGFKKHHSKELPSKSLNKNQRTLPMWFWFGAVLLFSCWLIMWGQFSVLGSALYYTFVPLWWGFIFFLDGILFQRNQGISFISKHPKTLVLSAISSIVGWYYFEFLNFFVLQNWYYPDLNLIASPFTYVWSALTFSTIWPSLFIWYNLLKTVPAIANKYRTGPIIDLSPKLKIIVGLIGCFICVITSVYADLFFWMVWLGPLIVVGTVLSLLNIGTPFSSIKLGDWSPCLLMGLATLFNGFFWEMWNFWSSPNNPNYWKYNLPYIQELLVFEMPILGFSGYIFFGSVCWVLFILLGNLFNFTTNIDLVKNSYEKEH
jgi:hypothetical protein